MKGWKIFAHSAQLILRNRREALQIALVPTLIVSLFMVWLGATTPAGMTETLDPDFAAEAAFVSQVFTVAMAGLVTMLWVAVNWHRFIMLAEYPKGWIPPFPLRLMLGYFGRSLMLVLLVMLATIPLTFILILVISSDSMFFVMWLLAYLFVTVALLRLSVILPAGAIEQPIGLGEAWQATQGATKDIVVVVLILFGLGFVLQVVVGAFALAVPGVAALLSGVGTVVLGMINISILTTLMGHYVQGRSID